MSKTLTLIRRLNQKTVGRKVLWEKTIEANAYQTSFREYTVILSRQFDGDQPTIYLRIVNTDGDIVADLSDDEIDSENGGKPHEAFSLMHETFKLARSIAMGEEQAVDSILASLGEEDDPF